MEDRALEEIWVPVLGHETDYEVSSLARIRGLPGKKNGKCGLKSARVVKGYRLARLWKNGTPRDVGVHVLVAEAFIGPRPSGMFCCHCDGDPLNNHADNLRWDTPKGNSGDRVTHGTHIGGSRNGRSVLDECKVRDIRRRIALKQESLQEIADDYGVSCGVISHIKNGRSWKGVGV